MSDRRLIDRQDWVELARAVRLEDELARRAHKLEGKVERVGPCPRCGGRDRFSINLKKQVWNCRGCGKGGDIIDLVQLLDGSDFNTACETLTREDRPLYAPRPADPAEPSGVNNTDEVIRRRWARTIWEESNPLAGTLGERYFIEHRQLDVRKLDLAHVLRWNPKRLCIVALMTDPVTAKATGVHRTFLTPEGAKTDRKMLGTKGCIRLSLDEVVTDGLGLCEGIEDALALLLSGWSPVWAAADAGSVAKFPVLDGIDCVTLFADADTPGMNAARECATRWNDAGVDARILPPRR
jgi:hypothetical protein